MKSPVLIPSHSVRGLPNSPIADGTSILLLSRIASNLEQSLDKVVCDVADSPGRRTCK